MKKIVRFLFLLSHFLIAAQKNNDSLIKKKKFIVKKLEITIDTFSISPDFFQITDKKKLKIPSDKYNVDFINARLSFKDSSYFNQEIFIYFLTYPMVYKKAYRSFYPPKKQNKDSLLLPVFSTLNSVNQNPKPLSGLKTEGSLRRGATIGNNQSLVMQSGLDLKIEGNLTDKIKIKAVLSDDNLPQAYAGISQSYKDFNRIYMQISGPKWKVTGGDLIIRNQDSHFLKFQRKTQGLSLTTGTDKPIKITASIVDGNYNQMQFKAQEGNLGPYLLKGKNNETYIYIIPSSEKIFLNGQKLTGEKDYKINYETGELLFQPTINITANSRITAQFNYANQNYLRYINFNTFKTGNNKNNFNIFSFIEQDNKYQTLLFNLSPEQVQALKNAGDQDSKLWVLSAKTSEYSPNKILYKKITTGNTFYFQYVSVPAPDLYEVRFSYLGKNQGSYQIDQIISQGKIYKYVGKGNGDYEPKIKLTAPLGNKYIGFKYHNEKHNKSSWNTEILINHTDLNTFSPIDDNNNTGGAGFFSYKRNLISDSIRTWNVYGTYDFVHQNFVALDPYREVEFARQWQLDSIYGKQHLINIGSQLNYPKNKWQGGLKYFNLRDSIAAFQIYFEGNGKINKTDWIAENRYTNKNSPLKKLNYIDSENRWIIPLKKWKWKNIIHFELRKAFEKQIQDTLNFNYNRLETGFIKKDSTHTSFEIGWAWEKNDSVQQNKLKPAQQATEMMLKWGVKYKSGKINWIGNYRQVKLPILNKKQEFISFQTQWDQFVWKKISHTQLNLKTYNGNILQDEIIYVETPPGQGNYQWNDYNENGIKEINEFEIAYFSDQAQYIRVILPSKNTIPTINSTFRLLWILNPAVSIKKGFLKHFYNQFSCNTSFQAPQNHNNFILWRPQHTLLNNYKYSNLLSINRGKKKYMFDILLEKSGNEQLLVIGKQASYMKIAKLSSRHFFTNYLLWEQTFSYTEKKEFSENYARKNFLLQNKEIKQNFHFIQAKKNDLNIFFQYKLKQNISGDEKLETYGGGIQWEKNNSSKSRIQSEIRFVNNNFNGNDTTPVAFQMLEGLQKGKNLLWKLIFQKKLTNYLEMQLQYNLRISEQNKAIHNGGILLKMNF